MNSKPLMAENSLPRNDYFMIIYSLREVMDYLPKGRSKHARRMIEQALAWCKSNGELLLASKPPEKYRVWNVLLDLLDNWEYRPIPFSKIVQKTRLKKPNIIRAINKLVTEGFIEKQPGTSKKRYRYYRLLRS